MKLHEKVRGSMTPKCPFKKQQYASVLPFPLSSSSPFKKRLSEISCPFFLQNEIRIIFLNVLLRGWFLSVGITEVRFQRK